MRKGYQVYSHGHLLSTIDLPISTGVYTTKACCTNCPWEKGHYWRSVGHLQEAPVDLLKPVVPQELLIIPHIKGGEKSQRTQLLSSNYYAKEPYP